VHVADDDADVAVDAVEVAAVELGVGVAVALLEEGDQADGLGRLGLVVLSGFP
jgi:hypothetical protein